MNWLRFGAELHAMWRLWISTPVEKLEVEDWIDSLPSSSSSTASSDDGSCARVLVRAMAGLRRLLAAATAERGRSSQAAVAGHERLRLRRGSRLLAATARVGSKAASV
jgi:hypothetical protein